MSSGFALMVIAAISLWMLRENRCALIAYATKLVPQDMSSVRSLAFRQSVIDKLTAPTSAGFFDARIFNRHLPWIRCLAVVYIFSRSLVGICAATDV